ncbi:MAG: hypothetical protein LBQ09_09925 [Acidobacteriaceae bacterium]|nr:hypothetical protein [Acidobacteriaceae bacterium]
MPQPRLTLARVLWLVCACLLLLPRVSVAAKPLLVVDLDGDGQRDRITRSHREPTVLRLWLSSSGTTQRLRASAPILHVVAVDFDGTHRPALIARDAKSRVHIWTWRPNWTWRHTSFNPYRPHVITLLTLSSARHHAVHNTSSDPENAVADLANTALMLPVCPLARVPVPVPVRGPAVSVAPPILSVFVVDPSLPRPPPPVRLA